MPKIAQPRMARCLAKAGKVGRQQDNLRPGREALPQTRRALSIKNTVAPPQAKAPPVKQDLREPEYRSRKERETPGTLHRVGGPKHQDRKEVRADTDEPGKSSGLDYAPPLWRSDRCLRFEIARFLSMYLCGQQRRGIARNCLTMRGNAV
jgi:hypothetical protein